MHSERGIDPCTACSDAAQPCQFLTGMVFQGETIHNKRMDLEYQIAKEVRDSFPKPKDLVTPVNDLVLKGIGQGDFQKFGKLPSEH